MLWSAGGNDTEFNLVQYEQNASEMAVIEVGITNDGKEKHFWNTAIPSLETEVGILTCARFEQPKNTESANSVSVEGMITEVNKQDPPQSVALNAPFTKLLTLLLIVISVPVPQVVQLIQSRECLR